MRGERSVAPPTARRPPLMPKTKDNIMPKTKDNDQELESGFVVQDPEVVKPKELPLLIKLPEGESWANKEQEEYAKILNAAAYCHPETWNRLQRDANGQEIPNSAPKHVELKRLADIGKNPELFYFHTGLPRDPDKRFEIRDTSKRAQ